MKKTALTKNILTYSSLLLLLSACAEDVIESGEWDSGKHIAFSINKGFGVEVSEGTRSAGFDIAPWRCKIDTLKPLQLDNDTLLPMFLTTTVEEGFPSSDYTNTTRATSLLDGSDVTFSTFVFGASEFNPDSSSINDDHQNITPTFSVGSTSTFTTGWSWEDGAYVTSSVQQYHFCGYYPKIADEQIGVKQTSGLTLNTGCRTLSYDVRNVSIANQPDFIAGHTASAYTRSAIDLSMNHQLCAVYFKLGDTWRSGWTVKSITFNNIKVAGTYDQIKESWSDFTTTNFTIDNATYGMLEANATGADIAKYLMMIPQSLSDISILINLEDGSSNTQTLQAELSGYWEGGRTVTYTITWAAAAEEPTINYLEVAYPRWEYMVSGNRTTIDGPFNEYAQGELFGVFAVHNSTKKIMYANAPMAASRLDYGSFSAEGNSRIKLKEHEYFLSANYTYFIYYPYRSINPTTMVTGATVGASMPDAETFFSSAVSGWEVSETQNTASAFKGQDLQIAKVAGDGVTAEKLTAFPVHKMSMAKLILGESNVTTDVYNYDVDHATPSLVSNSSGQVTATSVMDAATAQRMYAADGGYWTIVKATGASTNAALTLNSDEEASNCWDAPVSVNTGDMGYGLYKRYTAYSTQAPITVWNFDYNNSSVPYYSVTLSSGIYLLEVWGASGGCYYGDSGKGGYTYGTYTVRNSQTLYVCVGGAGTHDPGTAYSITHAGFNGGGGGQAGGGGATHMATALRGTGVLTAYESYQNDVLLVAGGAGNGDLGIGGDGGGGNEPGCNGTTTTIPGHDGGTGHRRASDYGRGGTSSSGGAGYSASDGAGSFGKGGNAYSSSGDSAAGGGGGWYGGGSSPVAGHGPGGGGSGHINTNNSDLSNCGGSTGVWGYSADTPPTGYTSSNYYLVGKPGQARITKIN